MIYSFDVLGSLIDLIPFGANVPSIGLNNSGKLVNIFTFRCAELAWIFYHLEYDRPCLPRPATSH